jgi:hypothetical protein
MKITSETKKFSKEEIDNLKEHKFFSEIIMKTELINDLNIKNNIYNIVNEINKNSIDIHNIFNLIPSRALSFEKSLRSLVWKLSLKYLPLNIEEWESYLDKKREEYQDIKDKYLTTSRNLKKKLSPSLDILSDNKMSYFYQDNKILELIEKDMKRTYPEIPFFQQKSKNNKKETNCDILKRLLFIYAKKYPEISYVQGLNLIIGNIFYVFSQDENPYFNLFSEEDTFYCFELLLNSFKDVYNQEKDKSEKGIKSIINYIKYLLYIIDRELFFNLNNMKIDIYMFLFKWYTVFFSQEFELDTTLKLWDNFICNENKEEYLVHLCLSAILIKKEKLLSRDIGTILDSLQVFQPTDIELILFKTPEIKQNLIDNALNINSHKFQEFVKKYCK